MTRDEWRVCAERFASRGIDMKAASAGAAFFSKLKREDKPMTDPINRLTAARFDGPQALYTEAVRLLTERPALPDDLDGLVARLRNDHEDCSFHPPIPTVFSEAADAIEALAAEVEALTNNGEKMLGMLHAATAREAEVRAEAWAAALESAAEASTKYLMVRTGIEVEHVCNVEDAIRATIPEVRK